MTDRVSGNGVTISAVKSIEYLPENVNVRGSHYSKMGDRPPYIY
jgi:hypothetical protein